MAALSFTLKTSRFPVGDRFQQTFRVTTGSAAGDEWIATGFSWIDAVVGIVLTGSSGDSATLNCVLNAQGTDGTEGDAPGDLGIEGDSADVIEVTIIGRP